MSIYLQTERMLFREFTLDDEQNLFELDTDSEVMKYLTGGVPRTRDEVCATLKRILDMSLSYSHRFGLWASIEKSSGQFMGWFHFRPSLADPTNFSRIELGYRLKKVFWGKGYATEGSRALIFKGFSDLGVSEAIANTVKTNFASRRVMEKSGLVFSHEFFKDNLPDQLRLHVEYSVAKDAWT